MDTVSFLIFMLSNILFLFLGWIIAHRLILKAWEDSKKKRIEMIEANRKRIEEYFVKLNEGHKEE